MLQVLDELKLKIIQSLDGMVYRLQLGKKGVPKYQGKFTGRSKLEQTFLMPGTIPNVSTVHASHVKKKVVPTSYVTGELKRLINSSILLIFHD
jgi:hypothetical protein